MRALLKRILTLHWLLTLVIMGVAAMGFGLASFNLFAILHANLSLVLEYGMMALLDGAFRQLLELIVLGYVAVVFFLLFKACERVLIERLLR